MEASSSTPPVDRHKIVYIIFVWLGVGTLLPWNFFITQTSYWNYRYRDLTCQDPSTDNCEPSDEMQKMWNSKMAVASMVPNVTMLILNAVFGHRFKTQPRLLVSLVLVIILFAVTAGLTKIPTDHWQSSFMTLTLVTVVIINLNAAIFQGGLAGVVGKFPSAYIGGVYSGQAISGIFASVTSVIMRIIRDSVADDNSKLCVESCEKSCDESCEECAESEAFFCFLIAVIFLILTLFLYIKSTRSKFYQFYFQDEISKTDVEHEESSDTQNISSSDTSVLLKNNEDCRYDDNKCASKLFRNIVSIWKVFGEINFYAISIFLTFAVSLSCFPAVAVLYESVNCHKYPVWAKKYFIPVCCFVLFNVGDYVGRFIAEKVQWPKPGKANERYTFGSALILFLSTLRVVFILLFINMQKFESDTAYIIIMLLFSCSQGYLCNICMMSAPKKSSQRNQITACNLMVAFLGTGLCVGAALSNILTNVFVECKSLPSCKLNQLM